MTPVLETERLILRRPEASDLPVWLDFFMSDRARYVRTPEPTRALGWRAFAAIIGHWAIRGFGSLVFADKTAPEALLGATGPWEPEGWPERELGWTLWREEAEGKGYAFEAASAARDHVFRDLGWETAVSYVDARNARSARLAERLGARPDWSAKTPDGLQCVVFRHPKPEGLR